MKYGRATTDKVFDG